MRITLVFCIIFNFGLSNAQVAVSVYESPKSLEETVQFLEKIIDDSLKLELKGQTEDWATVHLHLIAGMWISNKWKLWTESELKDSFVSLGVVHPYYMTDIIFTNYFRHLNGLPKDQDRLIKKYQSAFYGTMVIKNDTAYFPFSFFSFKSIPRDSILSKYFSVGEIIYVSDFDRLDSSTPKEQISYSKAKVLGIDSSMLKIQIIEVPRQRKRQMKRIEKRMEMGHVYDMNRKVGLIYNESPENCGFLKPKGLGIFK